MESLAEDLVATDQLASIDRQQFVSTIHEAARRGQFSMRLTMFAVAATVTSRSLSSKVGPLDHEPPWYRPVRDGRRRRPPPSGSATCRTDRDLAPIAPRSGGGDI